MTDPSQVNDATTFALDGAMTDLDEAKVKLGEIRDRLERQRAELQRERDEVRREIAAGRTRAARQAVVDHMEKVIARCDELDSESRRTAEGLDLIAAGANVVIARASNRCIIPFADSTGYCACYDKKKQSLAVLAQRVATAQAEVYSAQTEFTTRKANVLMAARVTFTLGAGWIIGAYIWFGVGAAALAQVFYALLAIIVALIILDIYLVAAYWAVCDARARLAKAFLAYYRLQMISTCKLVPANVAPGDEAEPDDMHDWWPRILDWPHHDQEPSDEPHPARVG